MTAGTNPITFHQDRASMWYLARRAGGVSKHWVRDAIRHGDMDYPNSIPTDRRHLSNSWLSATLGANVPGARVLECESPVHHSGTATRIGLRLSWNQEGQDADLPTAVFVKTTNTWQQRMILGLTGMVKGESLFYSKFRPQVDIEAPQGYYGDYDDDSWRSIAIMEDVEFTKGARFLDPLETSDRAGMEDLLGDLATLHGHFWLRPELAAYGLRDSFNLISFSDSVVNLRRRSHVGVERAGSEVPTALVGRTDEVYDANFATLQLDRTGASTLLHGDGHAGQRYVTATGRSGLADWQVMHRGHWAWDVAYTMNTALSVDDRRAWDRDLLSFYLERLAAAGGPVMEFDTAWREYRRHAFYPYIAWIFTLGRAAYHPNWQPDEFSKAIIGRTAQAIVDHDSFNALDAALH
jgi:hypothetical protein